MRALKEIGEREFDGVSTFFLLKLYRNYVQ